MANPFGVDAPGSSSPLARTCALDGCNLPAGDVPGDSTGRTFYCSASHRRRAGWLAVATTARCAVCLTTFRHSNPGRPALYCSDRCKDQRRRELEKGVKELARGGNGEDIRAARMRAELLWSVWCGHAEDDLVYKFWPGGRAPTPTVPPSPDARRALTERVARLRSEVRELDRKARHDERKAADRAGVDAVRRVRAQRREQDEKALSVELKELAKDGGIEE